ncbi:hypothetical protein CEXT_576641 [Caerostris extrusa]|uniref:Uncharacterized protein n=1 Tax=Caerostris extrusa TaxID=172846 RepID=A0AAV4MEY2_CAEEX|nr:hypothetical protein CEXT_576641 [Caerostris extrusa]
MKKQDSIASSNPGHSEELWPLWNKQPPIFAHLKMNPSLRFHLLLRSPSNPLRVRNPRVEPSQEDFIFNHSDPNYRLN